MRKLRINKEEMFQEPATELEAGRDVETGEYYAVKIVPKRNRNCKEKMAQEIK